MKDKIKIEELSKGTAPKGWVISVTRCSKGTHINAEHLSHGIVTLTRSHHITSYVVRHNGALANFEGRKGLHTNQHDAVVHFNGYLKAVSDGRVIPPKMHNIASI